jgi:hypothetical protein
VKTFSSCFYSGADERFGGAVLIAGIVASVLNLILPAEEEERKEVEVEEVVHDAPHHAKDEEKV